LKISGGGGLQLLVNPAGGNPGNWLFASMANNGLFIRSLPRFSLREGREEREAAKKLLARGIDSGQLKRESAVEAARDALVAPEVRHRAAITDPTEFGGLLRAIDSYTGTLEVQSALQLLALLFCRPGELRAARWDEFDFEGAV